MAEFCKECSRKMGMYEHDEPCFCEGCGKYVEPVSLLQKIKKAAGVCKHVFCSIFCKLFG